MNYYDIVLNWASLAAGANRAETHPLESGRDFVVQEIMFVALTGATVGSNIPAGTPFLREFPGFDVAGPSLSEVELQVEINGERISSNPWNALLHTGDGRNPRYPRTDIVVPGSGKLKVTLYNLSAVACTATLGLSGYYR